MFTPRVDDTLNIDDIAYRFTSNPVSPRIPYGQQGRYSTIYQVSDGSRLYALKVFNPSFRTPTTAETASRLRSFAGLPGLEVCARKVLTPQYYQSLTNAYPDLAYAVLMPWVSGQPWFRWLFKKLEISEYQSGRLAQALARTLATFERNDIAHCDLSCGNVMVTLEEDQANVALVDVEGLFAPQLPEPKHKPAGSPGYAHRTALGGLWSRVADRFAGAILLAEMLGWCDPRVRIAADREQYFHPGMHQSRRNNVRYSVLLDALRERWGKAVAQAFADAWSSVTLNNCPSMVEWTHIIENMTKNRTSDNEVVIYEEQFNNITRSSILNSFQGNSNARNRVYISYSHKDLRWLNRLQVHLKPLERSGSVIRWDDTMISAGEDWKEKIKAELASARVAILLISADFLASDFVTNDELPPLLAAAESEGVVVIPVIVGPSQFERMLNLSRFQAVNSPSRPLSSLRKFEQDTVFVKLVASIEKTINR